MEQKLYTVYYCTYKLNDFVPDTGMYPIFLSLDVLKATKFYRDQIKDAKDILDETTTSIEYVTEDNWVHSYSLVELELEKDLRYETEK